MLIDEERPNLLPFAPYTTAIEQEGSRMAKEGRRAKPASPGYGTPPTMNEMEEDFTANTPRSSHLEMPSAELTAGARHCLRRGWRHGTSGEKRLRRVILFQQVRSRTESDSSRSAMLRCTTVPAVAQSSSTCRVADRMKMDTLATGRFFGVQRMNGRWSKANHYGALDREQISGLSLTHSTLIKAGDGRWDGGEAVETVGPTGNSQERECGGEMEMRGLGSSIVAGCIAAYMG